MKTFLLTGLAITLAITIWAQHKKQNNMNSLINSLQKKNMSC